MKRVLIQSALVSFLILFSIYSNAQNVGINSTGSSPDASAMLDVASTTSGILVPRMTQSQRTAIGSPATGLLVYQTSDTVGFYYYDGSNWQLMSTGIGWGLTGNSSTTPGTNFIGTTDTNDFVFETNGNENMRIANTNGNLVLGSGDGTGTVTGNTLRAPNGSGTNIAGADITITPGNGTGTGGSGNVIFQTATAGSTGAIANTMVEVMRLTNTGAITFGGASNYGTSGNLLQSGGNGTPVWNPITLSNTNSVTGILSVTNGGTNSSTALSGSGIMISNGTQIVQGAAGTSTTVLHGNASGVPSYGSVDLTTDVANTLPIDNGGTDISTTPLNGQLLIGNGINYTLATLNSSGPGLNITTGPGSITFTNTGVTSETVSLPLSISGSATPNISLTGIVPVANGGTGLNAFGGTNTMLYTTTANNLSSIATANNGVLITSGAGVPSIGATLPAAVQSNITSVGTITTGTWTGTTIAVANGGTGLTSYTAGSLLDASAGATVGQINDVAAGSYLRSAGAGTIPAWSILTLPNAATTGDILYASGANVIGNLTDVAVGNILISGGVGVAPSWGKLTLATAVSGILPVANGGTGLNAFGGTNTMLYTTTANNLSSIATTNNGVLITSAAGVPSIGTTLPAAVQGNITSVGTITTGTWNGTTIAVANGGTGQTTFGGTNAMLYTTTANNLSSIATANNGVLITSAAGVPSIGATLPAAVQGNITSVGTIASGTWTGTTIAAANGGTGQTAYTIGDVLYASAANALSKLSDVAVGNILMSGGVGVAPSWGKLTLATAVSGILPVVNGGTGLNAFGGTNTMLYTSTANNLSSIATANNGVLITSAAGVPSIGATLPAAVQGNITSVGTITSGTWTGTTIAVAHGGTGLTAFGGTNTMLYTTTANNLSSIATANNGVLITSAAGVPSIGTTLPAAVQGNITSVGTIISGTWNGTTIAVANGGTGLTTFGGTNSMLYTTTANNLSSVATANNGVLITSAAGVPSIGATLPVAVQGNITSVGTITSGTWTGTTIAVAHGGTGLTAFGGTNTMLYTTTANNLSSIATANNGVLITSAAGVPSIGATLPSPVQGNITSVGTITSGTWNGTTVAVASGGTGLATAPSNGQLLIGNGSNYTLSALTAGTNISITNSAGGITIGETTPVSGTAGGVIYGTGSSYGTSTAGTTGQMLVSGGTGAPTWASAFSGTGFIVGTGLNLLGSTLNSYWTFDNSGTNNLYNNNTGNIGFGTSSPQNELDVSGGEAIGSYAGNNTAPSNSLIVSGSISSGTTAPATNAAIAFKNGHLESQQTTAPIDAVQTNAGTGGSSTLTNATDVGGLLTLNSGAAPLAVGAQAIITFNKPYTTAPVVVITPEDANTASLMVSKQVYVTSTTTTFTLNLGVKSAANQTYNFNYMVLETK